MEQIVSPTIDEDDMKMFNGYSTQWWNTFNGPAKIIHDINKLLIPYVQETVTKEKCTKEKNTATDEPLKGIKVLDAGCGGGIVSEALAKLGATVVGLDINATMIKTAKDHASLWHKPLNNLTYVLECVEDHAKINAEKYDVVVSNLVLEHINEVEIYLKACTDCLKPGGFIFVTTIGKTVMGWLLGIILPEEIVNYFPKGSHQFDKFVNLSDTEKMLKKGNCVTKEARGLLLKTQNYDWFWVDDVSAYYMLHSVKQG